jgi:hypothetical protein
MHTIRRPAYGSGVESFCKRYLDSIPGMQTDKAGNRIMRIGASPVMWSSHTDTVHKAEGIQKVAYGDGVLSLAAGEDSNCLGADDSAGVWIMRQMIQRKVSGLYIFHAAEEVGGHGSEYIARETAELVDGIHYAIALDRKGYDSVVTHQFAGRCASDSFAEALALRLGGGFACDSGGTFTDSANYMDLIPECSNLSVGYAGAHSPAESLDVSFCARLLESLCALDVSTLPVSREAGASDYGRFDDYPPWYEDKSTESLRALCWDMPGIAAELLADYGIDAAEFQRFAADRKPAKAGGWR